MRGSVIALIFAVFGGGLLKYIEFYYKNARAEVEQQPDPVPLVGQPGDADYDWLKSQYEIAGVEVFSHKLPAPASPAIVKASPEAKHKARMDAMNRSRVSVNQQWLEERHKHYKYKKALGEMTERDRQASAVIEHLRKQQEELKQYNAKLKNEIAELEDSVLPY